MKSFERKLNWGILSTGKIAAVFGRELGESRHGVLTAVASRSAEKAKEFAAEFPGARAVESYQALVDDPEVDALYIATPHPQHLEWAEAAIRAGKAVLCEKPITMNYADTLRLVNLAREHKVLLTEAFKYRCQPHIEKVVEWIRSGEIGQVGIIQSSFGFNATSYGVKHRLFDKELGGGAILDLGCYPVSLARLLAGAAQQKTFADPVEVQGNGRLHPETEVDTVASGLLKFEDGLIAEVACSMVFGRQNDLRIFGEKGSIYVATPLTHQKESEIVLKLDGKEPEVLTIPCERGPFALEADYFAEAYFNGQTEAEFMTLEDTLGNMQTLDLWREQLGAFYE